MVRIAYRDLAGLGHAPEISRELSELAEACVLAAAELARPRPGGLSSARGNTFRAVGLGKLGSGQMHYGSDLDLLFVYEPAHGEADPQLRAAEQLEHDRRAEKMLELLASVTAEGVAYPVDLRLRPEGASGLLARSWDSFSDYAREYMKPWERMALVRSRVLGLEEKDRWEVLLAEVVYGFDWNDEAIGSIRHLKRRMETELNKESRAYLDFKFGKGGISDLEFLIKALQIRYGSRHADVRAPGVDAAVPALQAAGALTAAEAAGLLDAHRFQRGVENRYQLQEEWNSREISRESPKLARLARSLGYPGRKEFLDAWSGVAGSVRRLVDKYFYELS
jgi:glutamate-ammonia-ligase adenylyltransferase